MGVSIYGPAATASRPVTVPAVDVRQSWADDWEFVPDLDITHARRAVAGAGGSQCELVHRYGQVAMPWETSANSRGALGSGSHWWVRVRLIGTGGEDTFFVGRVAGQARKPHGQAAGPSGVQQWVVHGPEVELERAAVASSHWVQCGDGDADTVELLRLPPLNDSSGRGKVAGNRSSNEYDESYVYGDAEEWTYKEYLLYLLKRFVEYDDGPTWTIGGQAEILESFGGRLDLGTASTAADIIRRLIDPQRGIDYVITPNDDGFEIQVYALTGDEISFRDETLPRNPASVRIEAGGERELWKTQVTESTEHTYSKIRLLGKRIVVCGSLLGSKAAGRLGMGWNAPELLDAWDSSLETEYRVAPDADNPYRPEVRDAARAEPKYDTVFQRYDAGGDADLAAGWGYPIIGEDGELEEGADFQNLVRSTLPWIPLEDGKDYTADPPTDNNPSGTVPDVMRPLVWFWQGNFARRLDPWQPADAEDNKNSRYCSAKDATVNVSALADGWGVWLRSSPNHLLAWDADAGLQFWPETTCRYPLYDWEECVATIAVESDHRLQCVYEVPDAPEGAGIKDIEVGDAEFWILAGKTFVQIDPDGGSTLQRGPDDATVVRDDREKLYQAMPGAIARYARPRMRAKIEARGMLPAAGLLGQILDHVEEGDTAHKIDTPISAVTVHRGGKRRGDRTSITTGHAAR